MHRFFTKFTLNNDSVDITAPEEIHHIRNVLRLKKGDKICIFNGEGEEACATVSLLTAKKIRAEIYQHHKYDTAGRSIILACAVPKKAKLEYIIEKTTELGVTEIIPVKTQRTEIQLTPERAEKKWNRYQSVAINAAKQSQRPTIPRIHPYQTFPTALTMLSQDSMLGLIPCLAGEYQNIKDVLARPSPPKTVMLFIGPEGDFTPAEIQKAVEAGVVPVSLGRNILKVDTAAIISVALAQFLCHND